MPVIGAPKGHDRYRDPNLFALGIVGAIPLGVYAYTWRVLNQDDFADIPIPPISDEELAKLKKEYESK
ncbi:hypothetical protein SBP28_003778 [Candidozyma auris]|nr:hypothetical protein CJJ09_003927 [[Candida] auris]